MTRRRLGLIAVLLVTAANSFACSSAGRDEGAVAATRDGPTTSTTSFEQRTLDTWHVGDDSGRTASKVTGVLRQSGACSQVEIDGVRKALTWPPGSERTAEGMSVSGHLYAFDQKSEFTVIKGYDGPQRPITCVTTEAWLVTR